MAGGITDGDMEKNLVRASLLITYNVTIVTLGMIGNLFVLYASLTFTEIGMNRITVILIKHLTLSDLLCLIFLALPALSVYICGDCMFGDAKVMCVYTLYTRNTLTSVNFKFVLVLSLYRLIKCYKPHLVMSIKKATVEWIAAGVYLLACLEISMTYVTATETDFTRTSYGCYMNISTTTQSGLSTRFAHFGFVLFIPFIGTITTNVLLWLLACRATQKFDLKPLLTVSVISGVLIISWLPLLVYAVRKYVIKIETDYMMSEEIAFNLMLFSMFSNPIVYTVFSKNLLQFLKRKLRVLCKPWNKNKVHSSSNNAINFSQYSSYTK